LNRLYFTWDDGHPDDLRLAALHEKYGLPCLLFVPAENAEGRPTLSKGDLRRVRSENVAVGAHTYRHRYLTELPPREVTAELTDGKKYLEDATGCAVEHFCFPGGRYNRRILREALSLYKTVRTAETMRTRHQLPVVDTTFHFFPRGLSSALYHSCRHREVNILRVALQSCGRTGYFELMERYLRYALAAQGGAARQDIIIWGHSWELTELRLWERYEQLLRLVAGSFRGAVTPYAQIGEA
jgi:peptidoglycan/xylan/chitin deacetylase (PgdA/CDA1 family)